MRKWWKSQFRTQFWLVWPIFGPSNIFLWFLLLLDIRHCYKQSLHAISKKTNDPKQRKWRKTSFWSWFRPVGPKFVPPNFFFLKNLALSVTRYHGQLSLCTISEKTNNPVLKKLGNGRRDGRTDGRADGRTDGRRDIQTDGREWFHRTLSD